MIMRQVTCEFACMNIFVLLWLLALFLDRQQSRTLQKSPRAIVLKSRRKSICSVVRNVTSKHGDLEN